ncbi:acyl-CoA-binding protein [Melittangium boletus]|uniref:Acyl-CoA-binding protein n=1 Tax=Melittangium boletus DSM 14713 TaxID=1294270 RepID=A0A250I6H0_9BACT|nr:acyl-CoA-binding protein [Melittangium boletus]ATB27454.1 acyl-CoA-binding protein [Melittangium boletus DSM 14713]
MSDLNAQFTKAQADVKTLSARPSNDTLLELYSLYKQATEGDVTGKRPGMLAVKDRAKYDAWEKVRGTGKTEAMQKYVDLVSRLLKK